MNDLIANNLNVTFLCFNFRTVGLKKDKSRFKMCVIFYLLFFSGWGEIGLAFKIVLTFDKNAVNIIISMQQESSM